MHFKLHQHLELPQFLFFISLSLILAIKSLIVKINTLNAINFFLSLNLIHPLHQFGNFVNLPFMKSSFKNLIDVHDFYAVYGAAIGRIV